MHLTPIDIGIIGLYRASTVAIGMIPKQDCCRGMLVSTVLAIPIGLPLIPGFVFPESPEDILLLYVFPLVILIPGAATIRVSINTEPDSEVPLKTFFSRVRSWGFWCPAHEKVVAENPEFTRNPNLKRDMLNIVVGIVPQTSLIALPILFVVKEFTAALVALGLIVASATIRKKTWYDKICDWPEEEIGREEQQTLGVI